jgi:hypothetical protein
MTSLAMRGQIDRRRHGLGTIADALHHSPRKDQLMRHLSNLLIGALLLASACALEEEELASLMPEEGSYDSESVGNEPMGEAEQDTVASGVGGDPRIGGEDDVTIEFVKRVTLGANYVDVDNTAFRATVCDREADGNGVYALFFNGNGFQVGRWGDPNGSASGCGGGPIQPNTTHVQLCEDDFGPDTCTWRVPIF